jgi:hypothetical protein
MPGSTTEFNLKLHHGQYHEIFDNLLKSVLSYDFEFAKKVDDNAESWLSDVFGDMKRQIFRRISWYSQNILGCESVA